MSQLNLNTSVGQWVAEQPHTSRVFERFRIDYCCGGGIPLAQACSMRQLDPQQVLDRLQEAIGAEATDGAAQRWVDAPLTELCDNIEQTHHAYLKEELPRLEQMIDKVLAAHGANHPEMAEVKQSFAELTAELVPHMFKEEQILFPAIRRLEQSGPQAFPFGTVANPIRMMEHEHDSAGDALDHIRRATNDYAVPDDVCNTFRALLDRLERLEIDMHHHVHKENSILFPRAIALEQSGVGAPSS